MGDVADPFYKAHSSHLGIGATRKESYEVGDPPFDVGVCRKASGRLGSFDFDMGDHRKAPEDATDASCAASYGVHAFFKLSDAAKAFCETSYGADCNIGGDAALFCEEDDASRLDWVSPRISFSQDLTMAEPCNADASRSGRSFPEKRKWQEGESGELDDGCSSEFEFLKDDVVCGSFSTQTRDLMLSADELFLNGKLLPMSTHQIPPFSSASHGGISVHRSKLTLQESHVRKASLQESLQEAVDEELSAVQMQKEASSSAMGMPKSKCTIQADSHQKPIARHLSLDLPKSISPANVCDLAPLGSLSVDNSPCSSPPRSSPPQSSLIEPTTTPVSHKANSKYTLKIKELFKPTRVRSSVNAQLTRDNSTTLGSTCRIPIPPRSFWPFSRSNSAGESKTTTPPPPTLPPRSNSAGESNISRVACKSPSTAQLIEQKATSSTSHAQDPMPSGYEDAENLANASVSNRIEESSKQVNAEEESVLNIEGTSQDGKRSTMVNKGRLSGSPGRASRKRYLYTSSNFLRGSPGRRGGMNAKVNTSRIVLRNLERCSADRKFSRESSGRHSAVAYPTALRVSPVLNVAVYRGKMPSSGMFGLRRLFSSKKEKAKDKEAAVNNWRVGA